MKLSLLLSLSLSFESMFLLCKIDTIRLTSDEQTILEAINETIDFLQQVPLSAVCTVLRK